MTLATESWKSQGGTEAVSTAENRSGLWRSSVHGTEVSSIGTATPAGTTPVPPQGTGWVSS